MTPSENEEAATHAWYQVQEAKLLNQEAEEASTHLCSA